MMLQRSMLLVALAACGDSGSNQAPGDAGVDLTPPPPKHLPFPTVNSSENTVLSPTTIVTVVAQNDSLADKLVQFGDELAASAWWGAVTAEYGVAGSPRSVHVVGPPIPPGNISDAQIRLYIEARIAEGAIPGPDGNTMYMMYLPTGVSIVVQDGTVNTDCSVLEGYHSTLRGGLDNYGIGQRCFGDDMPMGLDDITNTGAHEILEGTTDPSDRGGGWALPVPSQSAPWNDDPWTMLGGGGPVELGDLCTGTNVYLGAGHFDYQKGWSNVAAAKGGDPCVPSNGQPYYNVAPTTQGWYAIAPGQSVQIPLVAFAEAGAPDWRLESALLFAGYNGSSSFRSRPSATRTKSIGGSIYPLVNAGESVTLTVTAPADAASGDYAAFLLYSEPTSTTSSGGDAYHQWPVGVYVE